MGTMPETRDRLPWTYQHYVLLPDDGNRYEIIDGERFVTPAPGMRHQELSTELLLALGAHVRRHGLGRVFHAPCDVVLTDTDVVQPDLLFVSNARADRLTEANLQGAPDLAIEIVSPTTRRQDEILKRDLYGRHHVREYWIVDPELETVRVHVPGEEGFGAPTVYERGERVASGVVEGFELDVERLFSA